eukprot:1153127-Pelagomonas_calceolata.AAC.1
MLADFRPQPTPSETLLGLLEPSGHNLFMQEWGQLASIMRPKHAGVLEASHECVLHHQMAGRGARAFCPRPKPGHKSSPIVTAWPPKSVEQNY